jgi:hypothetical protein
MHPGRRTLFLAALLLLASFGVVTVETTFFHTDDGCAVETHCLACRFTCGATFAPAPLPAVGVQLLRVGVVPAHTERATTLETTADAPARAPPLA